MRKTAGTRKQPLGGDAAAGRWRTPTDENRSMRALVVQCTDEQQQDVHFEEPSQRPEGTGQRARQLVYEQFPALVVPRTDALTNSTKTPICVWWWCRGPMQ